MCWDHYNYEKFYYVKKKPWTINITKQQITRKQSFDNLAKRSKIFVFYKSRLVSILTSISLLFSKGDVDSLLVCSVFIIRQRYELILMGISLERFFKEFITLHSYIEFEI